MRISKNPDVRRQEILKAALPLFCKLGYEQTSMSNIAQVMGVAQGLCYRYFTSKEALFDAALDDYASQQADAFRQVICDDNLTLKQKILSFSFYNSDCLNNGPYDLIAQAEHTKKIHDQFCLKLCEKLTPLVASAIRTATRNGELHIEDPETAASFCVFGQIGITMQNNLAPQEKAAAVRRFLLNFFELQNV